VSELEGLGEAVGEDGGGEEPQGQLGGADAVAVAVALDAARHDPALSRATREYLDRQRHLVDLQIKHFDEEHRLAIAATRRRGLIDRLRIGLQLLVAFIGAAVVIGLIAMVWSAINDRGVVIDAFSVPADLADRGYTGEAIAKRILDRLAELNRLSSTVRAANSYANSLGGTVKLEIPETGVSIGELSRMLHEWLGSTTHVGGEITRAGENVSVRIRVGEQYAVESTGPEADLETLVEDAATKIYARTQPYRYGYWLFRNSDNSGAASVFRALAVSGPRSERVWAFHGLALATDSPRDSIAWDQQALELDPNFFVARLTQSQQHLTTGQDEQALKDARAVIAGERGASDATLSRRGETEVRASATVEVAMALGDYQGALAGAEALAAASVNDDRRRASWLDRIDALVGLHDVGAAWNALQLLPPVEDPSLTPAEIPWRQAILLDLQASVLLSSDLSSRDQWQTVVANLEQANGLLEKVTEERRRSLLIRIWPKLALAYARLGRYSDADAVLAAIPHDAYQAWWLRGQVAALRMDYSGAEKAFAEAVRHAPSIPRAYLYWGQMLAAKGDLPGAMDKYAEANRRGPQWADPLKSWGDALGIQGRSREALAKYNAALKRAPHWVELKAARDRLAGPAS
jgi:tetratricopeptide (TPR) repeat protein